MRLTFVEFSCGFHANWLFSQKLSLSCLICRDLHKNIPWTTLYVRKALPKSKSREQQFSLLVHKCSRYYMCVAVLGLCDYFSRNSTIHFVSLTLHLYELAVVKIQSSMIEYFGWEGRSSSPSFCSKEGHHSGQITYFRTFSSLVFETSEDVDCKNLTVQPVSMQVCLHWWKCFSLYPVRTSLVST